MMREIRVGEAHHTVQLPPAGQGVTDHRVRRLALTEAARFQASQLNSATQTFSSYSWEAYQNNWGQQGSLPSGVQGDLGFAVVNADGSFDSTYPLNVGSSTGLAIGGWTNSQPPGGLYEILKDPLVNGQLTVTQQTLLNNIVKNAQLYGFQRVTLDYEAYGQPLGKEPYTTFLQQLGDSLHKLSPPIQLQMAISPDVNNQNYYDLAKLLQGGSVDKVQLMCYDYASSDTTVGDNANVNTTSDYLDTMLGEYTKAGLSRDAILSKLEIGVPMYGKSWTVSPGLSLDDIQRQISAGTLQSASPKETVAEYPDDKIRSQIGDWDSPTPPWEKILVPPGQSNASTYYYNSGTGQIISSFPPQSMKDLASVIHQKFPQVAGFFSWQAADDVKGEMFATMMRAVMNQEAPPDVKTVRDDADQYLRKIFNALPSGSAFRVTLGTWIKDFEEQSFSDLSSIKHWFNEKFSGLSGDNDLYLQYPELLQSSNGKITNLLQSTALPSSLMYLEVGVEPAGDLFPEATPADTTYLGILDLEAKYPDQKEQLQKILDQCFDHPKDTHPKGSNRSQADISQFYWWPFNEGKGDGSANAIVINNPNLVADLKHLMCPGQA